MTDIATLTRAEAIALDDCEQRIERGLKTFIEVGQSLAAIRDSKLYRADYTTFEDYCQGRWGFTRQRAQQITAAAELATTIVDSGLPAPTNEGQARQLAKVPEAERAEVWRETVERTDGRPTAAAVQETAREAAERRDLPRPKTGGAAFDAVVAGAVAFDKAVADFPELEYYRDRPTKAVALADQLRGFEPAEQSARRETLAKVIQAERDGRLTPKRDPAAEAIDLADRLFVAANEVTQTAEKVGGAEVVAAAVVHADAMQIELWRDQFTELAELCNKIADACRPQLRRVQ